MPTELPRNMSSPQRKSSQSLKNDTEAADLPASYWRGVLKEFRNHLAIVVARSSELSTVLPGAVAAQAGDCLADIEASAARMEGTLAWMDAALVQAASTLDEVGEVLARAAQMAATAVPPRVSVRVDSRPTAIRNRGASLESAFAALIIELARGQEPISPPASRAHARESAVRASDDLDALTIKVSTRVEHGELAVTLTTTGPIQLLPSSWRLCFARALFASVGGVVGMSPGAMGFEVRFQIALT